MSRKRQWAWFALAAFVAVLLGLVITRAGGGGSPTAPAPAADVSVSCAPSVTGPDNYQDVQVTLSTNDLVNETVTVDVIAFDGATQAGSGEVTFGGPMAPGQAFAASYTPPSNGTLTVTSCEISQVSVPDGDSLNYVNDNPVTGGGSTQ